MLNDLETAKYVNGLLRQINGLPNESMEKVQETCVPEEFIVYRRRVGVLISSIFEQFLEPIYQAHPGLKPPDLNT